VISSSQSDFSNVMCVRCIARWEGSTAQGPKQSFTFVYNNYGFKCIDCIALWSGETQPESYDLMSGNTVVGSRNGFAVDQPYGLLGMDRMDPTDKCSNVQVLGGIALGQATDRWPDNWIGGGSLVFGSISCFTMKHTLVFIDPSKTSGDAFRLDNGTGTSQVAQNITSIRPTSVSDTFGASWAGASTRSIGTSLAAVADPWSATTVGANLCKRRAVDGSLTSVPRWPHPMNQRIKDATASAGAYSGPCPNCSGGRKARIETDVTAQIEALLGTIPAQCKQ
jgi:hypothetical protein